MAPWVPPNVGKLYGSCSSCKTNRAVRLFWSLPISNLCQPPVHQYCLKEMKNPRSSVRRARILLKNRNVLSGVVNINPAIRPGISLALYQAVSLAGTTKTVSEQCS